MTYAICILTLVIVFLITYVLFFQIQLRNINRQLDNRLTTRARQPISLGLQSKQLNKLAISINKSLKEEETLRLKSVREEKRFKEMIADISHDLRTPLTAIKGYQQLIENGELSEYQREKLQIAQKHTGELGNLIEHFFEYSYLLNAEPEFKMERINLTNFVTECLVESISTLESRNLSVEFKDSPQVVVKADREMLMRIIQNLIRNCTDHANGMIEVSIQVDVAAIVSFKNEAPKMTDSDAERLFDRFYTSDKSRNKTTGLGLSIVRLLAEQMGGSANAVLENGFLNIKVSMELCKVEG